MITNSESGTSITEIAADIFRISTPVPPARLPGGFTFNQYLVKAEQPLLFHCGARALFPLVSQAVATVLPVNSLRWISFGHVESDECGSMNQWLAAAPEAEVVHGNLACMVSLNDLADRQPRALAHEEVLDLGGRRVRWLDTPHVPHAWESGLMFEETTGTLFCGDLFTQLGDQPPAVTDTSIAPAAIAAEEMFRATAITPGTASTLRALKSLAPARLAVMHGACFAGDCAAELEALAAYCESKLRESL
ncbi:MAG: MBL fold metallo-hydrolase [Gammaproteobacteria bacterium]|jgi:flavorubredoxin|nr:MBL fold metallo-hydrolase [Gammaproteobacteria bacterium]